MHDLDINPWRNKAIALDRYRWSLLRERHGLMGSALRVVRDAIADVWFGVRASRRLASSIDTECCDFLLLQSAPKIIGLRRKKMLLEALRQRGYAVIETALPETDEICAGRMLKPPPFRTPLRYFGYAAHAAWIVDRFQPRVLLNDRNGSLYSPFLRLSLGNAKSPLVHLAHATTVESSRRLSMNDYDYYFLFGTSSLEALRKRQTRFGTSTAVLTGSHMIDRSFDLPPADPQERTMLILGVGPDKEKESGYQRTYELLRQWARQHPDYNVVVKRHPRSSVPFWQDAAQAIENVRVFPAERSLAQALEEASLVVNIMSNAVIEAGLAGRPVIYCNLGDDRDIFDQERFFGPAVATPAELQTRVQEIEQNFATSAEKAKAFAHFHLAHGSQGLETTLQTLDNLLKRSTLPDGVEQFSLPGTH